MKAGYRLLVTQAARFLSVGVLNTLVDWGVYFLLTRLIGFFASQPGLAKGISYGAGILNSYLFNRAWTFRSQASARATLAPFVLANLAGLALNVGVMQACRAWLHLPELLSLALATGATLAWNFTISKFLIFKR